MPKILAKNAPVFEKRWFSKWNVNCWICRKNKKSFKSNNAWGEFYEKRIFEQVVVPEKANDVCKIAIVANHAIMSYPEDVITGLPDKQTDCFWSSRQ
ncbi:hypothetical protein L596_021328 [Steinernema carpocapsae]|uniref:Uncharacterized protein n=1 Tax=Steinernema carpocapsae TaxID=34508 RepID=A0A4U5MID2_STECR|nr:hypothetical protein L596_021328 [Steinernema carpocapsae]